RRRTDPAGRVFSAHVPRNQGAAVYARRAPGDSRRGGLHRHHGGALLRLLLARDRAQAVLSDAAEDRPRLALGDAFERALSTLFRVRGFAPFARLSTALST